MPTGTTATDIKTLVCKHTGVNVNYKKITTWYDGTLMTDAKCDGVIYRKYVNGSTIEYYSDTDFLEKGEITFERFGGKADNTTDNFQIIQKAHDTFKSISNTSIFTLKFTR